MATSAVVAALAARHLAEFKGPKTVVLVGQEDYAALLEALLAAVGGSSAVRVAVRCRSPDHAAATLAALSS